MERGWSLIAVTAEPSLYLNVQLNGAAFRQVNLHNRNGAMRIGEMIVHLPITMGVEHEAFYQKYEEIYKGNNVVSQDRDLYRVQLPTDAAIRILEQINSLLPSGDRLEIYQGVGMVRQDYHQKSIVRVGGADDDIVFDSGHGRYAVVTSEGMVKLYEQHRLVDTVDYSGEKEIDAVYVALDWVSYEPLELES